MMAGADSAFAARINMIVAAIAPPAEDDMATDQLLACDAAMQQAAFDRTRALQSRELVLSHREIERGLSKAPAKVLVSELIET